MFVDEYFRGLNRDNTLLNQITLWNWQYFLAVQCSCFCLPICSYCRTSVCLIQLTIRLLSQKCETQHNKSLKGNVYVICFITLLVLYPKMSYLQLLCFFYRCIWKYYCARRCSSGVAVSETMHRTPSFTFDRLNLQVSSLNGFDNTYMRIIQYPTKIRRQARTAHL